MTGRTHDLAAFTAFTVVVLAEDFGTVTLSTVILSIVAVLVGGITPDIDQPTAPFWRNLPIGKYFGRLFDDLTGGHRFLTHSILGLILFGFAAHWLLIFFQPVMPHVNIGYVWWAFMIGMISHLIMDSFTKEGVPWLLPIPVKFGFPPTKHLRLTTGKRIETLVIFPVLAVSTIWLLASHYNQLVLLVQNHIVH